MGKTIGKQLKLGREAKNLTIQKVVEATRIRAHQIEAIEADDFESLPSPVQARAFLRLYAEFLGLSLDEIITRQLAGSDELSASPSELAPALVRQTAPITGMGVNPAPVKNQRVGEIIRGLLTRIKQDVARPGVQSAQVEQTETNNQSVPFEGDGEEQAVLLGETPVLPSQFYQSQVIFTSIGQTLCQRRESLSLSLDEIERQTHVGKHYLQALEAGEFILLPSSVQARGMLNNYAHFLNLDVDALLLTFAEGLQTQRLERQFRSDVTPLKPVSKFPFKANLLFKFKIPVAIRRYLSVDIFVGGGLVLLLLTFVIWGTSSSINLRADSTPQPTAPSISNILVSPPEAPTATITRTLVGNGSSTGVPVAGETLVLTLPAAGHGSVQVVVIAQDQAWVRVTVDGEVQFQGRVTGGIAYPFDGNTQIEVLTGDGRAISIQYNQTNMGPMGNNGEIVDRIYTTNAILNPTATYTSTPTITSTPTATMRPSATLRPSSTPRSSATPRISPTQAQ